MCTIAKFDGLRMSDLFEPDADRTIKILSALVNLSQFKEERIDFFEGLVTASTQAFQEQEALERTVHEARARADKIKCAP